MGQYLRYLYLSTVDQQTCEPPLLRLFDNIAASHVYECPPTSVPRSSRLHADREDRPGSGPLLTPKASDQRKPHIIKVEPRSMPAHLIRRIRSHVSESRSLSVRSKASSLQKDLLVEGGSPYRRG